MAALDEHLAKGRLGVEEYGDRSAAAANAVSAADLAALFTDLPAPHPTLPGTAHPPRRHRPTGVAAPVTAPGAAVRRPGAAAGEVGPAAGRDLPDHRAAAVPGHPAVVVCSC